MAPSRVPRLMPYTGSHNSPRQTGPDASVGAGTVRRVCAYSSSERTALRRNAPVFLFRRDKSRLYGSLDLNASCRDRKAAAPKKDTLPSCYPNLVNESWYILSNPGTSWFRRGIISDAEKKTCTSCFGQYGQAHAFGKGLTRWSRAVCFRAKSRSHHGSLSLFRSIAVEISVCRSNRMIRLY